MNLTNLFWIFLIITSLQPIFKQKILEASRVRLIKEIERKRKSRVIVLIHREETLSILGFPLARYIDIQDSEQILRAIKLTDPDVPIDLIVHTPGGLVLAAEQIAYALCRHPAKVTVMVPHYAMSGGTMIALAADEILMDENAVLGPVDPQIGGNPAASILSVLEHKELNEIDDQTLILADIARKAQSQVVNTLEMILAEGASKDRAKDLAQILASGRWTHDYPISVEEARKLDLSVQTGMPEEVYQLMALHPQQGSRRPSVEYVPVPYRPHPATPARDSQSR